MRRCVSICCSAHTNGSNGISATTGVPFRIYLGASGKHDLHIEVGQQGEAQVKMEEQMDPQEELKEATRGEPLRVAQAEQTRSRSRSRLPRRNRSGPPLDVDFFGNFSL